MKRFDKIITAVSMSLALSIFLYLALQIICGICEMGGIFKMLLYIMTIEVY